jgi:hypothetical protein
MDSFFRMMRITILAAALVAVVALTSYAGDISIEQRAERIEKIAVLAAFAAIDYRQSCDIFYGRQGHYELNPVIGKQPSRRGMLAFGTMGIGLLWGGAELLERAGYPRAAQVLVDSALSSEQWNIEDNVLLTDGKQRRINAVPIVLTWRW